MLTGFFCRFSAMNEATMDNVLTNYESINVYNEQVHKCFPELFGSEGEMEVKNCRVQNCRVQLQGTIYIDSVFLVNLVMDLYLLALTARILGKTATCPRIFLGSAVGAAGYCIALCITGIPYPLKVLFGMIPVGGLMVKLTCRTKDGRGLLRGLGILFTCSFFLGGVILFLKEKIKAFVGLGDSMAILFGAAFLGFTLLRRLIREYRQKRSALFCRVSLMGDLGPVEFSALIDTGNGLVEPISHKPVAILEADQWKKLKIWMRPEKYKIIPYHSIGRENGMMEGYEIDTMKVRGEECEREFDEVIIAVFKGKVSKKGGYQMILPPELSV